jgi:hypothetical protein
LDPLIVAATGGLFTKNYQFLMSYKGLTFFTKPMLLCLCPAAPKW